MKQYLLLFAMALLSQACTKEEGYGGLASISGKVYAKDVNSQGELVAEDYLGAIDVYISESGNKNYFDKTDTSYDGSFSFKYLHKGTYDVWVYGDCDSCDWDQTYVLKTITITGKDEDVVVEDFVINI